MNLKFSDVQNELSNYYCTDFYHRVSPFNDLVTTDGVEKFIEVCECFWAIQDFIGLRLYPIARENDMHFLVVEIEATKSHSIKFRAFEDNGMPIIWQAHQKDYSKSIPIGTYKFYLINNVLLLPSEY